MLYFNDQEEIVEPKLTPKEKVVAKIDDKTNTLITDLNYSYSDLSGNNYELFSDYGKIDINNSDEIHMTNVVAKIHLKNSSPITINAPPITPAEATLERASEATFVPTTDFQVTAPRIG